ncbi:MAG: hypothetical protein VB119_11210 [Candidatus Metalachnospira sp.]|nr:hypothetical protein [Candidatus Metalachnospira sp.]
MSMKDEKARVPFYCTWVFIAIVAVIIWPIAVLLVWRRGQFDRKTSLNLGTISMVFGVVLMAGAIIISYVVGDEQTWAKILANMDIRFVPMAFLFGQSYMVYCAVYGICGAVFARMGYEGYKKSKVFRNIISAIEDSGIYMVPMLADEVGMPEVDILKTLEKMFKKGLLPRYELTRNNKKVVKKQA